MTKPSIVIAESSSALAREIAGAAMRSGWEVAAVCEDGVTALVAARRCRPTIVTLDFLLPRLSGAQLAVGLAQLRPVSGIVVITAVSSRARVDEAKQMGALGYVLKPIAMPKLEQLFARLAQQMVIASPSLPPVAVQFK